ncbi:MAG: gluconate transporter, partial [Acidobacteriota bacterium]
AALGLTGLIVAIPVFFDVAFILLVPLLRTTSRRTGRPLIAFAIPLLAGLAVAHAFVPPTPGPVAVAGLLGADLGRVIALGLLVGLPAMLVGGVFWGAWLARQPDFQLEGAGGAAATAEALAADLEARAQDAAEADRDAPRVGVGMALGLVALPLAAILTATVAGVTLEEGRLRSVLQLLGHPFSALLLTTLLASWLLARRCGWSRQAVEAMASASLKPVGLILLLTGAGGVLGKILLATGAGEVLARALASSGLPLLLLAFVVAVSIRIAQGSATVSMVTAAGLLAPLLEPASPTPSQLAALTLAIAAGATAFSHVNDSGFWLVSRYLGLTERQTLRSWTVMTALVGFTGLALLMLLSPLLA